ncbi:hypothetical protein CAL7716_059360 [Calothrix sp. PCC 7716]|nr:hypothetical protein CAL7716_059360 [Calothrix sp. PCC 7716]
MTYCNWSIDVKGYYTDEKGNFTAIVPLWSSYSRYSNQRPVNHLKITGVVVRFSELHKCENADWHPGNPISQEKWIQVRLRWCKWSGACSWRKTFIIQNYFFSMVPGGFK